MRVISGISKGHRLKAPKGMNVRPTEDRIKESLFNIIGPIDNNSVILDLFGGSGSIGIEFLSRGAKECYFIDISAASIVTIKENLIHTKLIDKAKILKKDGIRAIDYFKKEGIYFDYVYLDPPFRHNDLLFKVIESIDNNLILSPKGILIVEHEKELVIDDNLFRLRKVDYRKYGSKSVTFLKETIF